MGEVGDPLVSVVVPNYRHERYLPERLDSILNQTYRDFELILLDDASPDESVHVLEDYAERFRQHLGADRVQVCFNIKNSGSAFAQWKRGIGMARGTYVWIAESDDSAEPGLLEALVNRLESDPGVVLAYCESLEVNGDGEGLRLISAWLSERAKRHEDEPLPPSPGHWSADYTAEGTEELGRYFSRINQVVNASGVVFDRASASGLSPDPRLRLTGDWAFWACLGLRGRVSYCAKPLNRFRLHDQTVRESLRRSAAELREEVMVLHRLSRVGRIDDGVLQARARSLMAQVVRHRESGRFTRAEALGLMSRVGRLSPKASVRALARRCVQLIKG